MDFFGLGFSEILVILIVAVIFLGPEKLPEVALSMARWFKKFRNTLSDVKQNIDREINIEELKKTTQEYKEKLDEGIEEIKKQAVIHDATEVRDAFKEITEGLSAPHPEALTTPKREIVDFSKKGEV